MSVNGRLKNIQAWLWPNHCRLCAARLPAGIAGVCEPCGRDLPRIVSGCARCANPLAEETGLLMCGACQQHPPAFDRTVALFRYGAPVDHLIQRFKFHGELALGPWLAAQLGGQLASGASPLPDCILPVPLHRARLRSRGYNQALELARPLARRLAITLDVHGVERVVATRAQAELSGEERRRNLRNAFAARRDYTGLHVAIVDDVMTTGATAEALARCLKRAGANEVSVWVLARA